jgi:hypothetical protein
MSTLKVGPRYQEPTVLIVPSAAGFPLVFRFTGTRGRCWLSTAFGLAMAVTALWTATAPFASAAVVGAEHHINAARAAAIHECSVLAGRYSQHDWGNTEIYQYRACMAAHDQRE